MTPTLVTKSLRPTSRYRITLGDKVRYSSDKAAAYRVAECFSSQTYLGCTPAFVHFLDGSGTVHRITARDEQMRRTG
jgi:hypothetical protein